MIMVDYIGGSKKLQITVLDRGGSSQMITVDYIGLKKTPKMIT